MGSTLIINQTKKPLDMKIGNYRYFINLATVEKDSSYRLNVNCNDTFREYRLNTDSVSEPLIINSDECVDNKTIIISEVNGQFDVKMEPRDLRHPSHLRPPPPAPVEEHKDVNRRNKRAKVSLSNWRFQF